MQKKSVYLSKLGREKATANFHRARMEKYKKNKK